MHKHFLMAVHKNPAQVARLVRTLAAPDADVWIHVDATSPFDPFCDALAGVAGVHWIEPRVNCIWGGFSQVEATLACLRAALSSGRPGYLVFGSGQDYPIKDAAAIDAYLTAHADVVHADTAPIDRMWPDQFEVKITHYCLPQSDAHGDLLLLPPLRTMSLRGVLGWARRLMRTFGVRAGLRHTRAMLGPRGLPFGMPHGGSQWWGMPWDVARDVVAWTDAHPDFAQYFRYSQCPDEMFFHTALARLEAEGRPLAWQENLTYIDWSEATAGSPKVLTAADVETLAAQPEHKLFARKFDESVDAAVLDILDDRAGRSR